MSVTTLVVVTGERKTGLRLWTLRVGGAAQHPSQVSKLILSVTQVLVPSWADCVGTALHSFTRDLERE